MHLVSSGETLIVTENILDRLLTTLAVRIHAFAFCEIKAGWRLAFDSMDAVIVHYVLAGAGSLRIVNGPDLPFAPCSIMIVPAGKSQSLGEQHKAIGQASAAENCSLLDDGLVKFTAGDGGGDTLVVCATISATYGGALGLFDDLQGAVVEHFSESETVRNLFAMMLGEVVSPGIGTQALTEALMKQCLILVLRHHLARFSTSSPLFAMLQDRRLARAVTGVLERPSASYTVDTLAALAGMSRSAFAERFADVYGQGPIEFVQRVRLRVAADLLRSTDLPVKVIATSVGYSSRSYFTRAFRAVHGIDPTTFRKRAARNEQALHLAVRPPLIESAKSVIEGLLKPGNE